MNSRTGERRAFNPSHMSRNAVVINRIFRHRPDRVVSRPSAEISGACRARVRSVKFVGPRQLRRRLPKPSELLVPLYGLPTH